MSPCHARCPQHGCLCSVVDPGDMDEDGRAMAEGISKLLVGHGMADGHTVHLCLADPFRPHTWVEEVEP